MLRKLTRQAKGFTLIELMVVVAIVSILGAIAMINYLDAQTRSKVSRVKSDMKIIATAVESYAVENNYYPNGPYPTKTLISTYDFVHNCNRVCAMSELTTPVSYISSVEYFRDPFQPFASFETQFATGQVNGEELLDSYLYFNLGSGYGNGQYRTWSVRENAKYGNNYGLQTSSFLKGYIITSNGPNRTRAELERGAFGNPPEDTNPTSGDHDTYGVSNLPRTLNKLYDPTNGTLSDGDIGRIGGETRDNRVLLINGN